MCLIILLISIAGVASISPAATITGQIADYNAASVAQASGQLTIPGPPTPSTQSIAVYHATTTIATGNTFIVTLPAGFTFTTQPTLSSSASSTFGVASGGIGSQSVSFSVATANVSSGDLLSLSGFSVAGATVLQTITPGASALPITMQAVSIDVTPLSLPAFASSPGAVMIFVRSYPISRCRGPRQQIWHRCRFAGCRDQRICSIRAKHR